MRKLKFIFPILLLASLILTGAICEEESSRRSRDRDEEEEEEEENYLSYENQKWSFKINYIKDWEMEVLNDDADGLAVGFLSPQEDSEDDFQENVIVGAFKSHPDKDFDELMEEIIRDIPNQANMDFIDYSKLVFVGYPAYKFLYTEKVYIEQEYKGELKYLHYFVNTGDVWYQIMYIAEKSQYSKYLEQAEQMINSFEIL